MNAPLPRSTITALPETLFAVPGMRCAGCISKLEHGLPQIDGVAAARVNFTAKRVAISHLPETTVPDLQRAIASLGFESQPIGDDLAGLNDQSSRDLLKAMAVAGFAMMNIMLLSVSVWSGADGGTRDLFHWLSALIALPTVAYSGRPFFRSAWGALKNRRTNMDVPISIGVILTTALSLHETFVSGPHAYFDGVVMLLFFLLTGRWLDSVMRDRARDGVSALLKNKAAGALILSADGTSSWLAADALKPEMVMLVAAGERLAADGIVTRGRSHFDLSLLTGESEPATVATGDTVHAGTLNIDAPVEIRITATGSQTALADIARLMEDAGQSKSRYVRIADRAARFYAPAVHTLALLSFAGWMLAGAGWHQALLIAVAVLIITCPCALGLAVPVAQIVTAGALMKRGILVKDGSALERLAEVDRALFDKTGTLTLGRPTLTNPEILNATEKEVALALARTSRHPLSQALRRALGAEGVKAAELNDIRDNPGQGVEALHRSERVRLERPDGGSAGSSLAVQFRIGDAPAKLLLFEDELRPGAKAMLDEMKALGIEASIASGDRAAAVQPVAHKLQLTAQTGMLPQDKLDTIVRLSAGGHKVLMVGDGLNDGPALAAGHASLAPASASDAGQNAADAVFMGDSLEPITTAIRAARATQRIVKQNFVLAIGYNVVAVPLAIMGLVTPLIAALAMSGSSIIVVANALRLKGVTK
ncbi:MAG: heavy metal translocating P-type ATPase [Parasphingorhabdus sp.]|nr:heavy metal translocating P-type ATPase [Parasphingorhabdus sp.]